MAQVEPKDKGQFQGASISITTPERGIGASFHYGLVGPDGATEKHVAVNTDPKARTPHAPAPARRTAERAKTKGSTYELRNMRATLVAVGPSVLNGCGVLLQMGNLVAMLAKQAGKPVHPAYMRKYMWLARPTAARRDIDEAVSICLRQHPYEPSRRSIGQAIGLDADVWEASDSPAYIYPFNRTDDWVSAALEVKAAIKKAARQKRYRERNTKPRKTTKAEIAARMGISRMQLWRRERAAKQGHVTRSGDALREFIRDAHMEGAYTVASKRNVVPEPAPWAPPGNVINLAAVRAGIVARTLAVTRIGQGAARIIAGMTVAAAQLGHACRQIWEEDAVTIEDDTSAESADATRPIVAPGDDRPDDPHLIPTRHEEPPAAPRTAPAARAPIYLDPADDDHDTNAELAARELEKAAYRAERAAQAQSAAPTGKTTSQDRGASTAVPGRPQGTLRHPAWGAGYQPSTGGRAPDFEERRR